MVGYLVKRPGLLMIQLIFPGEGSAPSGGWVMTFDRRYTIRVWFRRGLTQDEMQRIPNERKMARHFHTDVGFFVPDPNSIWFFIW